MQFSSNKKPLELIGCLSSLPPVFAPLCCTGPAVHGTVSHADMHRSALCCCSRLQVFLGGDAVTPASPGWGRASSSPQPTTIFLEDFSSLYGLYVGYLYSLFTLVSPQYSPMMFCVHYNCARLIEDHHFLLRNVPFLSPLTAACIQAE